MSALPKPVASASIKRGTKTNRVRVKAKSAGTALRRFRQDPTARGMDTAVVAISMPAAELAQLDAMAERVQMARSHFIRQAVKHFGEKLFQGNQERMWRKAIP